MKIEWLNDDLTHARLTVGWWRRRSAEVKRTSAYRWVYIATGRDTSEYSGPSRFWLEDRREKEILRRDDLEIWTPVARLPKARVQKG